MRPGTGSTSAQKVSKEAAAAQERFQSCLKTSAQGIKFVKLKATLANVRFWDSEQAHRARV